MSLAYEVWGGGRPARYEQAAPILRKQAAFTFLVFFFSNTVPGIEGAIVLGIATDSQVPVIYMRRRSALR